MRQLSLIDNKNINLDMLSKSEIHLNENGTAHPVNNFCYSMNAWQDKPAWAQKTKQKKKNLQYQ